MSYMILPSIILPIAAGLGMLFIPERLSGNRKIFAAAAALLFIVSALPSCFVVSMPAGCSFELFTILDNVSVYFSVDNTGRLFAGLIILVFILTGFFSISYMQHENNENRFFGFYLITFGVLIGLAFAGNILTFYLFYEFMTLVSVPLVLHDGSRAAVMAAFKYLLYSFCGAYMALFGIYFLYRYAVTLDFVAGGSLDTEILSQSGNTGLALMAAFLMIIGFGVKAGCFPLHAWLPAAHPVAPAPASAFLSGIIVKGGILGIIRTVYYCFGADFLRGTWVQTVWASLAVITLLMGSSLAFKEKILKKRLAYSTVSNLAYILLGLSMLNTTAFIGSMLHVVFHAFIKSALFLAAGALIFHTGRTRVNDFTGLAGRMPVLFWCYTIVSLGLIGIPPMSGLVSKWYLATGCMESGINVISWLGAVSLLVSALLTAGYLLPVSVKGFLYSPVDSSLIDKYHEPAGLMLIPIMILTLLTIFFGIYPTPIVKFVSSIADCLI